jgi:hypothetical protein
MWLSSTFSTWGSFLVSMILPIVGVVVIFLILIHVIKCAIARFLSANIRWLRDSGYHKIHQPCLLEMGVSGVHKNVVGITRVFIITPSLMIVVHVPVVTVLGAVTDHALSDVVSHLLRPFL